MCTVAKLSDTRLSRVVKICHYDDTNVSMSFDHFIMLRLRAAYLQQDTFSAALIIHCHFLLRTTLVQVPRCFIDRFRNNNNKFMNTHYESTSRDISV